jgi:hypothetical protein
MLEINFTNLHNQAHLFGNGLVTIDQEFSGNLLAIDVTTKPEYVVNSQVIGYLYQIYESASKGYAIKSGKDMIRLELPEADRLVFAPTAYLSDSYTLKIDYTTVGLAALVDGENIPAIPEQILNLPTVISGILGDVFGLNTNVENIQSELNGLSLDWAAIGSKPSEFPPSEHTHAIADVTGLESFLTNELAAIDTNVATLSSRVNDLESAPSLAVSSSAEISMSQGQSTNITAQEILRIYRKVAKIGINLIPTMTSNTSPIPLVASTNGNANGSAFNVFDKVLTDRGWLSNAQTGGYVQIDMGVAITADTLSCLVRSASVTALEYARKLTLVTSHDGVNWSTPKVAITNWLPVGNEFSDFAFPQTTARYWRLFCEDRPSGYPAVNEMKLSLSTGFFYLDVTKDYTISKEETPSRVFTLRKNSPGSETIVVSFL